MKPSYYRLKSAEGAGYLQAGLVADDLDEQGLTEFVAYGPDGADSVNYGHMAALFANAISELHTKINEIGEHH